MSFKKTRTYKAVRKFLCLFFLSTAAQINCPSFASDWEDSTAPAAKAQNGADELKSATSPASADSASGNASLPRPLKGKIEKSGEAAFRIQRQGAGGLKEMPLPESDRLEGKAIDDELRGLIKDGSLKPLAPLSETPSTGDPLKGRAELQGGKGARFVDPDSDDSELLVEWDRWRNRFLRAIQLGTQEILNNPDPDDYERPHFDARTGMLISAFGLGTSAAFSCQVTSDGQIKNLEIISPSGHPRYDRAVLRAVQQLASTQILNFPKGSHRKTVTQPGRITTANSNDFKFHHFGDVEHIKH